MPNIVKLMQSNDEKLKSRLRKGIPDGIRMLVWPLLAEVDQMKQQAKVRTKTMLALIRGVGELEGGFCL